MGMKLYICPLCWKVVDGVGMPEFEVKGFSDCPYCGKEIIPLATPQEIEQDYLSFANTTADDADAFFVVTEGEQ